MPFSTPLGLKSAPSCGGHVETTCSTPPEEPEGLLEQAKHVSSGSTRGRCDRGLRLLLPPATTAAPFTTKEASPAAESPRPDWRQ